MRQGLVVGAATGLYGVSFGALATTAGLSTWQALAMSLLLFSGGSQFAFIGVLASGGNHALAIATSSLLGVRNGLYGMQVRGWLGVRGVRRLLAAQLTIDESTAVGLAQPEPWARRWGFWTTGIAVYIGWNAATAVGAVVGDTLGDPRRYGLDAMAAAAFLALLWPRLRSREPRLVAGCAAVVAAGCVPWAPAGVPVLVAGLVAVVVSAARPVRGDGSPRHQQPRGSASGGG
ncbi:MAG: AzlC family ABC transporter permease [Angustibacter sp.]